MTTTGGNDPTSERESSANPRWKLVRRLLEIALWVVVLAWAGPRLLPQVFAVTGFGGTVGDVPEFSVVTLDGDTVTSEDLRGSVTVLNFWATWCRPCALEMPSLQKLHEDRADEGVRVIGFSTDVTGVAGVERVLAEREISYPVAMVGQTEKRAFGGVPMIPTTLIIDRDGVIRHRVEGLFLGPAMRIAVNRILKEELDSTDSISEGESQ